MRTLPDDSRSEPRPLSGRKLPDIPVRVALPVGEGACDESGVFALQVLGESMMPEFEHGDIIVAEADGQITDGAFVVARSLDEWALRQLVRRNGQWVLVALDGRPEEKITDLSVIRGVVIQKSKPGRRRSIKRYV